MAALSLVKGSWRPRLALEQHSCARLQVNPASLLRQLPKAVNLNGDFRFALVGKLPSPLTSDANKSKDGCALEVSGITLGQLSLAWIGALQTGSPLLLTVQLFESNCFISFLVITHLYIYIYIRTRMIICVYIYINTHAYLYAHSFANLFLQGGAKSVCVWFDECSLRNQRLALTYINLIGSLTCNA